jgi:hypothetical protein
MADSRCGVPRIRSRERFMQRDEVLRGRGIPRHACEPLKEPASPEIGTEQLPGFKGEEMGWFEHGSTIIVLAPAGFALCEGVQEGVQIRMGRPLIRLPAGTRH